MTIVNEINWEKVDQLVPAVIQDCRSQEVLMLGYMNQEALKKTLETKKVTFFSRTKQRLWTKGETSGNVLNLVSLKVDCDNDTVLIQADPIGPTCHTGTKTCFGESESSVAFLMKLESVVKQRFAEQPEGSYVTSLIKKGVHKMAQKVGEEGVEVALAAKDDDKPELIGEMADLVFHLTVLMEAKGVCWKDVTDCLQRRNITK